MPNFVVIFKRGRKKPFGVIPAKKGVPISKLRKIRTKQGFIAKIMSSAALKRLLIRLIPKKRVRKVSKPRRKTKKRSYSRKKYKVRRKRKIKRRIKRRR